jgi:hypothetical protein
VARAYGVVNDECRQFCNGSVLVKLCAEEGQEGAAHDTLVRRDHRFRGRIGLRKNFSRCCTQFRSGSAFAERFGGPP